MRHHWAAVGCEIELGWVGYRGMALRLEVRFLEAVGCRIGPVQNVIISVTYSLHLVALPLGLAASF